MSLLSEAMKGNSNASISWTDERTAALRTCLSNGLSFSQAAAQINAAFGTTFTRNAAIGKANRIGFKSLVASGFYPQRKPRGPTINAKNSKPRVVTARVLTEPAPTVEPKHLIMADLKSGECHWPFGSGPYTFCGHLAQLSKPYCRAHQALSVENRGRGPQSPSYKAAVLRKRAAASVVIRSSMDQEDAA
jgi:GcrA cell cycle regulator